MAANTSRTEDNCRQKEALSQNLSGLGARAGIILGA
jgi:hypothetical protein